MRKRNSLRALKAKSGSVELDAINANLVAKFIVRWIDENSPDPRNFRFVCCRVD
jgi:hypothetical protein